MKKRMFAKIVAICLSLALVLPSNVGSVLALGTAEMPLIPATDYNNEFFITQAESVNIYNQLLEGFSTKSTARYATTNQTAEPLYPDYFGGAYIDNDTGELVVLVKETTQSYSSEISELTNQSSQVRLQSCDISQNEMTEVIDFLSDNLDYLKDNGIIIDMISDDIMKGKVIVSIVDHNQDKEQIVREFVNCDFLDFCKSEGTQDNATNLGGGNKITSDGKFSTIGFAARRNGVSGFVIAGHSGSEVGKSFSYNGTAIGSVTKTAHYNNSTADAAFITANSNVTPTNGLANGGYIWSASTNTLPINTTVYMYGVTSGLQSGKITSTNSSMKSNQTGLTIKNLWTANYASAGGDSGAPIMLYEGNYGGQSKYSLYGIHKGINTTTSFLSTYKNIVNELGATCITG